ncbi:MAG: Translation initiation factor IF-3 [Parcubacteria group bacterium GW2011_GWB1_50_9]|nr:MAG: Translation initiation factor IF-3 [Parcubacteria group bacterium GW2011_GWB1_50_9]KKW20925.1 MAG: translation initiation factor IF-3, translation initiation factor IF-3 [Candidatus Adlerbacteria bacterium GW2011_GWC1_50_9]
MDFGKFKYEREKGDRERGRGKKKEPELKELRIGFTTGKGDLARTAEKAKEFLERGDKVRISMRLRGREKAHGSLAMEKFKEFLEYIPIVHRLESPPKRFPQGISTVIVKE